MLRQTLEPVFILFWLAPPRLFDFLMFRPPFLLLFLFLFFLFLPLATACRLGLEITEPELSDTKLPLFEPEWRVAESEMILSVLVIG